MAEQRRRRESAFFRGESGMRKTDEEIERAKQRAEQRKAAGNMPFRFRVPVGETRQIIVCDDKPDFFMYEHALKDADGNWGRLFSGCTKTFDNCPVCEATNKESYYAMFLTVIDLTPFTLRDGTEVEFSRKLLVVKPAQQKKFLRFYNKEGTLRGAMFDMTRDGDKDSSIGNDIEFVEFVDEKEMESYTRSWKDREGKKHTENCDEPYVYEELFEEPTTEALRELVGGDPAPGSRAQSAREVGSRRGGRGARDDDGDGRPSRTRAARGRRGADDDWEKNDDDRAPFETDEEAAAAAEDAPRRRGRGAETERTDGRRPSRGRAEASEEAEAPPRRGRRAAEPEAAEDGDAAGEEEAAPRRLRPDRTRRAPAAEEEPETPRSARAARRGRR